MVRMSIGGVLLAFYAASSTLAYSSTGKQAFRTVFAGSTTCQGNVVSTQEFEEQTCSTTPYEWTGASKLPAVAVGTYNSFEIDCDDYGNGSIFYTQDCKLATGSVVYSVPQCVKLDSTTSMSFYCLAISSNTLAPSQKPSTLKPTNSRPPSTPYPTKSSFPTSVTTSKSPTSVTTSKSPTTNPILGTSKPTPETTTMAPVHQMTNTPTSSGTHECMTMGGTTQKMCKAKLSKCAKMNAPMKWVGLGCVVNGKRQGDGGCQCEGTCQFACKELCDRNSKCEWRAENKKGEQCVTMFGFQPRKENCML